MNIKTIGVNLAKNRFQVRGVDKHGKVVIKKALPRDHAASFFAKFFPKRVAEPTPRLGSFRETVTR